MKEILVTITGSEGKCIVEREWIANEEVITFIGDADIDADGANGQIGAKVAYNNKDTGSEFLANGGMKRTPDGEVWFDHDWGKNIVILNSLGRPRIFENGLIASKTAYKIPGMDADDPKAYIDSETVPYIAIPPQIRRNARGVVLGCLCECRNVRSGVVVTGMVADIGPRSKFGEVSIAMARMLGINHSPRNGGTDEKIIQYTIRPNKTYVGAGVCKPYPLIPA